MYCTTKVDRRFWRFLFDNRINVEEFCVARKKWVFNDCDREKARQLAKEADLSFLQAVLLMNRGVESADDVRDFLSEDIDAVFEDPFMLIDMDRAVDRIEKALAENEKICVFGDYDIDGITATVILYDYLKGRGANVFWNLPSRLDGGYGVNPQIVHNLKENGFDLVITVDNGVSAFEEVLLAKSLGLDILITDHHTVPEQMPECIVVNPKRRDCPCSCKDLCGAGVVFKLICALEGDTEAVFSAYGGLVALATIGDIVSLTGENRTYVKAGLKVMAKNKRPGLIALAKVCEYDPANITVSNISYALGPRLNAAGRMAKADLAAELLLTRDEERAGELAQLLNSYNTQRQKIEQDIMQTAMRDYFSDLSLRTAPLGMFWGEEWPVGVVGVVASKICDRLNKPIAVFGIKDGIATGSARSVPGFSVYDAFNSCRELYERFGGHEQAVGLTVKAELLPEVFRRVNEYADRQKLRGSHELHIDGFLQPQDVNLDIVDEFLPLEPFGRGNSLPYFCMRNLTITNIRNIKNGEHCIIDAAKNGQSVNMLYFGYNEDKLHFKKGDIVDTAVQLGEREYMGAREVSVVVKDIRYSSFDQDRFFEEFSDAYRFVRDGVSARKITVARGDVADLYRILKTARPFFEYETLYGLVEEKMTLSVAIVCCEILIELGLLKVDCRNGIYINKDADKVNLEDSGIFVKASAPDTVK